MVTRRRLELERMESAIHTYEEAFEVLRKLAEIKDAVLSVARGDNRSQDRLKSMCYSRGGDSWTFSISMQSLIESSECTAEVSQLLADMDMKGSDA